MLPNGEMGRNTSKYCQFGTSLKPIGEERMRKKGSYYYYILFYIKILKI
jgi:hypothetical protein